jgi:uracil-DNA glycosylase
MSRTLDQILSEIRRCAVCAANLPLGPRPIVQMAGSARVLIIGQAPGSRVHASGVPWRDRSGDRLREWMGIDEKTFYDENRVALVPMGFCYPGAGASGDLPPRRECAPLWHERLLSLLPERRLTLLVGAHAQAYYLRRREKTNLTDTVRDFPRHLPGIFPLPHPSWRSTIWMRKNSWFECEALPSLREEVARAMAERGGSARIYERTVQGKKILMPDAKTRG